MTRPVVLASASPRRRDMLQQAGLQFTVDPVDVDEQLEEGADPLELARSISLKKAQAAAPRHPGTLVIAADTFGWMEGRPLGKPRDKADAVRMLEAMSGRCHRVITGYTILDTGISERVTNAVETLVCFRDLSNVEIREYVETGEPLDKAGAYAIQGLGGKLVKSIEGDYYNVMGLPVHALAQDLAKFGVRLPGIAQFERDADSPAR